MRPPPTPRPIKELTDTRQPGLADDKKSKAAASTASTPSASASAITAASPGPVVNQLDETAWETFATGRPLEDSPDLQQCKHCKKSILKTAAKVHIAACLRVKKEKAQRKKEAREARERAKEQARAEEERKAAEEEGGAPGKSGGGGGGDDDDSDEDEDGDKKMAGGPNGGKTTKKATASKKADVGGKKRKAEGDPDKGPKSKKKKEEAKPKLPKPKGTYEFGPDRQNDPSPSGYRKRIADWYINRACRCREAVWCSAAERAAVCSIADVQESLHGREAFRGRQIITVRHAPRRVSEEEPGQAAKWVSSLRLFPNFSLMLTARSLQQKRPSTPTHPSRTRTNKGLARWTRTRRREL